MVKKRMIACVVSLALIFSLLCPSYAMAAEWRTGDMNQGYAQVYLTNMNKAGYVRVHFYTCLYGATGHKGSCKASKELTVGVKVPVTYRDTRGKYITTYKAKGGEKLKLGNDHSGYRLSFSSAATGLSDGNNFLLAHWGVECAGNTHF